MIEVNEHITIPEEDVGEHFIRCSGPGGQHVNKSSTGVQLRFDVEASTVIPDFAKAKLKRIAGSRLTSDGEVVISATNRRSQKANREEAQERLAELVRKALVVDKPRRKSRPSYAAKARRLEGKQRRSETKKNRKSVRKEDY
jgi:ribosome-associated protein